MNKVEYLNKHGDWIHSSWHKNEDIAIINAQVKVEAGYQARVLFAGKVIWQG